MFQYPSRPNTEHEARALIWGALVELAALSWREWVLEEYSGANPNKDAQERMQIEQRQAVCIEALNNYSSQRWVSSHEYSEWWSATVGESDSDVCKYCFEW